MTQEEYETQLARLNYLEEVYTLRRDKLRQLTDGRDIDIFLTLRNQLTQEIMHQRQRVHKLKMQLGL